MNICNNLFHILRFRQGQAKRITPLMRANKRLFSYIIFLLCLSFATNPGSLYADSNNKSPKEDGYTINYKDVSIVEYIRFVSKICNTNFIFNESELQFNVTVVSEEPITPENVMSTLIQILRMHNLSILEQDDNLVIHQGDQVRQLADVISSEHEGDESSAPLLTRVFRIRNVKVGSLAQIIRPMISQSAILETSGETGQLIITDVRTNIEKVAELIDSIDSPLSPMEIEIYRVKNTQPEYLIKLTEQIMAPLSQGHPLIFVSHDLAQTIYIVSTPLLVEKSMAILSNLDAKPKVDKKLARHLKTENVYIYKVKYRSGLDLEKALEEIAKNLKRTGFQEADLIDTIDSMRWIKETHSFLFTGSKTSIAKVQEILESLDTPIKDGENQNQPNRTFFMYKPTHVSAEQIEKSLQEVAENLSNSNLPNEDLINTLKSAKLVDSTQSILLTGDPSTFMKAREILGSIDTSLGKEEAANPKQKVSFYIYKIEHSSSEDIISSLKEMAIKLKNAGSDIQLANALNSVQYNASSHSLFFTGSKSSIDQLKTMLPTFDIEHPTKKGTIYIYQIQHASSEQVLGSLDKMAKKLKSSNTNPDLVKAIEAVQYNTSNHSLFFTGSKSSIAQLQKILPTIDVDSEPQKTFLLYKPQNVDRKSLQQYLTQVAQNLKNKGQTETGLYDTVRSAKWISESKSFMFSGSQKNLTKIKEILADYDLVQPKKSTYLLYKLQNVPGNVIEDDLNDFAKNLKKSGSSDESLIDTLKSVRWIKETNSLLIVGNETDIEEVKAVIEKYDIERETAKKDTNSKSTFYVYKPQHLQPKLIKKSLLNIASSLKDSELADPNLLSTLEGAKIADTTKSVIFTGTPESIEKVKELLSTIDIPSNVPASIQHIGETTYLLYKLQHASKSQITSSIRNILRDLKKSGSPDTAFINALNSMKYVKDTNSLLFTGTAKALEKVQNLIEKFDHISLSTREEDLEQEKERESRPSDFFVYKPKFLSGSELEQLLEDFAENLQETNLSDPDLFRAIRSSRWVEKTNSLIITGTPKSIEQVKALLAGFDIEKPGQSSKEPASTTEPIDKTSFLVYKLQYHKGSEIQTALHQIAADLIKSEANISKELVNSVNSIQWIKVTNSLLGSGNTEVLKRLKELIKALDIPLKQVFIEMLVIDTDTKYNLDFGLTWGGKSKYKDKWAGSYSNVSPALDTSQGFPANLDAITPSNPPKGTDIPFTQGFDLGIIGDVIKHNGKSFFTLGSLLTALQDDEETTIVTTPKVITQDGKTASIFIGANVPYTGSFVSNSQSSSSTIQTFNLEYRDIGVEMKITPVLGNSDIVTLDLDFSRTEQESATSTQINFNTNTATGITTTKTSMDTTVHVPNKTFLVLSGMVLNTKKQQKSGVPCLGGIPWLGAAFSRSDKTNTSRNVVIFMKPHIINSLEDMKTLTEDQEDYFLEYAGSPVSEQLFDEAIETFKSPHDD